MPDYTHQINPLAAADVAGEADRKLVIEAAAGGHQALEDLVIRHQSWIYNLAFRMVMVREEAEDVTQEVLVKIITKLATYDPEKAAFRTWLYRIVTNHVINMKARGLEAHITDLESY
jgi:RNA polymerase sigma factor (sigma-70 family)